MKQTPKYLLHPVHQPFESQAVRSRISDFMSRKPSTFQALWTTDGALPTVEIALRFTHTASSFNENNTFYNIDIK